MEELNIEIMDKNKAQENMLKRIEAYARFLSIIEKRGITPYNVSKNTGIATSTLSDWKNGKSMPKPDKMEKIANYIEISVDYLITGKEPEPGYYLNEETAKMAQEMYEDADMRSLFDMKRKMSPERFSAHVKFMKELYEQENGNID